MRDDKQHFDKLNAVIYGINPSPVDAHARYVEQLNLNFPLLSDGDRSITSSFQCLKENGTSVERTVYIIDAKGIIRFAQRGMPSDDVLLEVIKRLEGKT
ncbi:MAG: redoxin domain-containing protein [Acidobacteria bacterium]|nr:redoxin domain-containing protein [Acidobacteriota bacterium]